MKPSLLALSFTHAVASPNADTGVILPPSKFNVKSYGRYPKKSRFNDLPLLVSYPVKPANDIINLFVRDSNLTLDLFALCRWRQGSLLLVHFEHTFNERDKLVMDGLFCGIIEIDGTDGELFEVLGKKS